jgi:integrase
MRLAATTTTFADVPLKLLRRSHVESWVKAMQTVDRGSGRPTGLAPGTIRTRFNNVRTVLRAAVRDKLIYSDPTDGVRLPRTRRREAAMALPSAGQVKALLDNAEGDYRAFVALCAFAGLRLGEAAALQVGDLDFIGGTVRVTRQVQRENGGGVEIRAPKYGSEREVYLAARLSAMLAEHVAQLRPGARWLFRGDGDQPPHQNTVAYWWRRARTRAGCPAVRLHDLRHFYASGLIAEGCDVVTVQRALGHRSATVTLSTYAHLWPSAEDRTRGAASSLIADVLGPAD